ncbi:MAG: SIMPL domain-containing protein [Sandaracinaceae bacterium]|nr:SIMPL domain-containing protein [Sandaracinaceae bacterium]
MAWIYGCGMYRRATWILALLLASGCGATAARPVVVSSDATAQGIEVTGRGEAREAPDVAVFVIGVEAERPTVADAREEAATAATAVLAALRGAGISGEDVQTTEVSIRPDYEHTQVGRHLRGYLASNRVEVRVRDLDRVQQAIDTAITAGGDRVRLDSLSFELSQPEAAQQRGARPRHRGCPPRRAPDRGRARGRARRALSVEEVSSEPVRPVAMRMAEAGAPTPIQPGTSEVAVEVRVRWAIGEPTRQPEAERVAAR